MDAERQGQGQNSSPPISPLWPAVLLAAITVVWFGFLAYLAATSANPNIIDRRQLLLSDAVVAGRITQFDQGLVAVDEWLRGEPRGEVIRIRELDEVEILPGDAHLFPLTFIQDGPEFAEYVVTPSPAPVAREDPGADRQKRPTPRLTLLPISGDVERQMEELLGKKPDP